MKLSIIIPAYNEEEAIASTIDRTLAAKSGIIKDTGVEDVEVVVVNDGSTDGTQRIAQNYKGISFVSYDNNKGYGAAIKQGFARAKGDLLSFMDGDGTCDPALFSGLVNSLVKNDADIAIGSRLGPGSKMPMIRRLGNTLYAKVINFFADTRVSDPCSGMRVLKSSALEELSPLPDGLNFTPAMTSKALMGGKLKLVEVPIDYAERTGKSKLSVIKDGLRFLGTILASALQYRKLKVFMALFFLIWVVIWGSFTIRSAVVKGELREYSILAHRSLEGKASYVTGDRLYEFIKFCNDKLPAGSVYKWTTGNEEEIARRRATYYLYPHIESKDADFVLVFDDPNPAMAGYGIFASLDGSRYILKKKETSWK